MLTMLEEVVLLAVDETSGGLRSTREFGTAYALVGAVFFDLALARKIDTGTDAIHIIDKGPTGSPTLDRSCLLATQRVDTFGDLPRESNDQWLDVTYDCTY